MSSDRDEMLQSPFLSIVVPVHNEQAILDKQVEVIRRSMDGAAIPYEVLLVENGSRDQTLEICRELAQRRAELRVLTRRDPSIGGALRLGLREARGPFAYLTAIDFWSDEFLRDCLARAGDYDFIIGSKVVPGSQDRYVLDGAPHPAELSILHASIASENEMPQVVARSVIEKFHPQKVGIAGLAYKGDIKVAVLSPTIRLVQEFREHGIDVKVNDPYYTPEEIQRIAGVDAFEFPDGLAEFDTVMLVADHLLYRAIPVERLREHLRACRVIIDNTGLWESLRLDGIEYCLAGAKGWIHTPKAGH